MKLLMFAFTFLLIGLSTISGDKLPIPTCPPDCPHVK